MPPRLFLDFRDVRSGVPSVIPVELGPIERVRVAPNSRTPLVTRVVLDLRWPAAYRIETSETNERELRVIVLNDEALPVEPAIRAVPEVAEPAIPEIPKVAQLVIQAVPEVPEVVALASPAGPGPADVTDVVAAGRPQRLPANSVFVDPMAALRVEALQSVESLGLAAAVTAAQPARGGTQAQQVQSVLAPAPIPPPATLATVPMVPMVPMVPPWCPWCR